MFRKPVTSVFVTLLSFATLGLCNLAKAQSFFATYTYAEVLLPDQTNTFTYSFSPLSPDTASSTSGTGSIYYQDHVADSSGNYYYTVADSSGQASPTGYANAADNIVALLQVQNSGTTDLTYDVQVFTYAATDAQAISAFTDYNDAAYGTANSSVSLYNPSSTGSPSGVLSFQETGSYALRGEFPFTFSDSPAYTLTISAGTTQYLVLGSSASGYALSTVPEPGFLAFLATSALTGAGFLARRRKNARQAA